MDKTNSTMNNKIKNNKLIKRYVKRLTWKEIVMLGTAALASIDSKGNQKS